MNHHQGQDPADSILASYTPNMADHIDTLEDRVKERLAKMQKMNPSIDLDQLAKLTAEVVEQTIKHEGDSQMLRHRRDDTLDEALLAQASALGLPDGMTDPNQVLSWLMGKLGGGPAPMEPVESMADPMVEPVVAPVQNMAHEPVEKMADEMKPKVMNQAATVDQIKRALQADQVRRTEIQATCTIAKVERAFADELCDKFIPLSEARKRIIERMQTEPLGASVGGDVRVTKASEDKFIAAVSDGLVCRSKGRTAIQRSLYISGDKPAEGHEEFSKLNLIRMATLFGERAGLPVQRMSNPEIARAIMRMSTLQGAFEVSQRYRIERSDFQAYHTTGSFANLLLDASNKTLLAGYEEAPYTWNLWARTANSVDDFKNINRTRFSEAPNPEEVPEGKDYPEKAMSDAKESYRVAKFGESFSVSWETIVNDDLDALSRIPAMHGNAMRRFQNRKVYEVLTSNPLMGDGNNLFSSSHVSGDNTSGASAAPSVTTLNTMFVKMMTQKGLNKADGTASDAIINVMPKFVIVPVALSATLLQLVASLSDPNAGGTATGNANTLNIYGPNGMRPIVPIIEPQLDGRERVEFGIGRGEPEPLACRTRGARHHACAQGAKRPRPGAVVDVVVPAVAAVAVLHEVAAVARQDVGREFLPVCIPRGAFALELPPTGEQSIPRGRVGVRGCVSGVLAHVNLRGATSARAEDPGD